MSRRQRSPRATPTEVHPTHAKILAAAMAELTEYGFDLFNVQRVLEAAGVSRGTLYHHFADVESLIEEALVETFAQENVIYRTTLDDLMARSTDRATFRQALRDVVQQFSQLPAIVRLRRTHTITLSATRPSLGAAIANVQDAITDAWTDTVREAQRRGYARPDLDPRAIAVMIQAIGLGRIVDDAAGERIDNERWAAVHFAFLDAALLVPGDD